ncbi:MAG: hypothetical protein LBD47_03855 [Treponema sp.]|jgi:hypothetical protein|nr:hypothetical protein [Treponema sp.]
MEKWLPANLLADLLSITKRAVNKRAKEKNWPYRTVDGNGGPEYRYHIKNLPEDIQAALCRQLANAF